MSEQGEPTIEALASVLRGPQAALITTETGCGTITIDQVGGFLLPDMFPMPVPGQSDPVAPRHGEPIIETFVVEHSGPADSMGSDELAANWWLATVGELTARVVAALTPFGVELAGPIYVIASATDLDQVIDEPHLDDDQYQPDAGVGVVAIAASHLGPRLARGSLPARRAVPGGPLDLDPAVLDSWFDSDRADCADPAERAEQADRSDPGDAEQWVPADRIVVFPRFGQLHRGPTLAIEGTSDRVGSGIRNLLVLRADTVVVQPGAGSVPT